MRDEGDDAVLDVEEVRVDPEEGGEVGRVLEEVPGGGLPELADREVEELLDVDLPVHLNLFSGMDLLI